MSHPRGSWLPVVPAMTSVPSCPIAVVQLFIDSRSFLKLYFVISNKDNERTVLKVQRLLCLGHILGKNV